MPDKREYDAIVVGSGPNGLAAAITLARKRLSVLLIEVKETIGGGMRTAELTLPGFQHDVCSAIHPLALSSPFFRSLDLAEQGLDWIHPPGAMAHPFDDGSAIVLERSIKATAAQLGSDAPRYAALIEPISAHWGEIAEDILGPLRLPRHPLITLRFGRIALDSARHLAERQFADHRTRAVFAGIAVHSIQPLGHRGTAAAGLMLSAAAHAVGWPIPRGGSQRIADALTALFVSLGGTIETGRIVNALEELPESRAVLLDITPRQLARIAGHRLTDGYRRRMENHRYGPGVFKIDWALDGPIPWTAAVCSKAGTVHLGGTLEEIVASENAAWEGKPMERPFIILAQQSLFDPSRAPAGKHTAWAYCHVPNGSPVDMTDRIERQIERFAPGFRGHILARSAMSPAEMEEYNPNYVGGDIGGGVRNLRQLFIRPLGRWRPYTTPIKGLYLCSSSMPPGGGVHGMCGYHAARAALRAVFRL
ncbi:MAG: NAD(P)/FAD-dependent oxidoreductase [Chloroflexi bacterium]|nr:NAD(P)/FAD-dependent oxidoreductase [Chloroflexota bacterium]